MQRDRGLMRDGMASYLRWCGAPASHLEELISSRQSAGQVDPMVRADRMIEHGDLVDVPGLRLRAVWTPGHTPGHLCFHDETHDLLLTGDHILPRITPNVSSYDLTSNPLEEYLGSLAKLRGIQPREVLPAHEYRFSDLDSRLDFLAEHHAERLAETAALLAAAGRLASRPGPPRPESPGHGPGRSLPHSSGRPRSARCSRTCGTCRHAAWPASPTSTAPASGRLGAGTSSARMATGRRPAFRGPGHWGRSRPGPSWPEPTSAPVFVPVWPDLDSENCDLPPRL